MYKDIYLAEERNGIAIASTTMDRDHLSNFLAEAFRYKGYRVYQVNPSCVDVNNKSCFSSIDQIYHKIDTMYIVMNSNMAEDMARQAAGMGVEKIWINLNYDSPDFLEISRRNGLSIFGGECFYLWKETAKKEKPIQRLLQSIFS